MFGWLQMLIAAFVGFMALGAVLIYVSRRLSSAACPACFKSVPKNGLKLGMPCPECEHVASLETNARVLERQCRFCATDSNVTHLWDGQSYCRDCMCNVSTELWIAASKPVLSEDLPYETAEVAKRALWFYLRVVIGFSAFWGLLASIAAGLRDGAWFFGIWLMIGLPVCFLWTLATTVSFPLAKTKSMVWSGQFMVRIGTQLVVAPLTDISWRIGRMSQHTVSNGGFLMRGPSVIIELPNSTAGNENCVAVGCTPNELEVWRSFLTIADVRVASDKRKRNPLARLLRRSAT